MRKTGCSAGVKVRHWEARQGASPLEGWPGLKPKEASFPDPRPSLDLGSGTAANGDCTEGFAELGEP